MSKQDDAFMKRFGVVLGLLVLFVFFAYFLGTGIAKSAQQASAAKPSAVNARIRPVGTVTVAAAPAPAAGQAPASKAAATQPAPKPAPAPAAPAQAPIRASAPTRVAAAPAGRPPEDIYKTTCIACHLPGIANAPKIGDKAAWGERAKAGLDSLVNSVLKGKGVMPPKAGRPDLTEPEIRRTIQWFLKKAGVSAG